MMKEKSNFLLTWYNDVFNVIVESTDGEITAKSNHFNCIEFVKHDGKPAENLAFALHYDRPRNNKLNPTKSTSDFVVVCHHDTCD